jgi:hypothetical protein
VAAPRLAHRPAALVALGTGALLALLALFIQARTKFGFQGTDDANIVFVYARHLLAGLGPVYAADGGFVEGFSSPLWLLACTLATALPYGPEPWLLGLSWLLTLGSIGLVLRVQQRQLALLGLEQKLPLAVLGTLGWVALSPSFITWQVLSLMDTALLTFLISAALDVVTHADRRAHARRLAWLAPALVLARPEGFLWAFGAAGCLALTALAHGDALDAAWRRARLPCLVAAGCLALWVGTRRLVFGGWIANAVLAKQSLSPGWRVLDGADAALRFFAHQPPLVVLAPFAVPLGWVLWRRWCPPGDGRVSFARFERLAPTWFACAFALAGVLLPIASGGDHFGGFRLFQPVFLLFIVPVTTFAAIASALVSRRALSAGLGLSISCLALGVRGSSWPAFLASNQSGLSAPDLALAVGSEFWIAQVDRQHGRGLSRVFHGALPRIGYAAAGGIAVGYEGSVIDLMGLNEPLLARTCAGRSGPKGHSCFDVETFFRLAPDAFLPRIVGVARTAAAACPHHLAVSRRSGWDYLIFRGLFGHPRFLDEYALATVHRGDAGAPTANGYFRREFLAKLGRDPSFQVQVTPWEDCHV